MMIKNVIFDIGGVLLLWDPEKLVKLVFGKEHPEILDIIHSDIWKRLDEGTVSNSESLELLSDSIRPDFHTFLLKFTSHMTVLQDGVAMVQYSIWKDKNIYILSNFHREGYELIKKNEIFADFDGGIVSSHVKMNKPNPGIYKALLDKYQLNPSECVFIDDKEENVNAANDLKIHGILCKDHSTAFEELKRVLE